MLLVAGEPQGARTALALLLSGRMKPGGGTVTWGSSSRLAHLRKHSAVVDSPNINDPEAHLKVRDVVSEDLSLIPSPPWRKPNPKKWMAEHGYGDIAGDWVDAVDPVRMTEMLTQLAAENPQTRLLVVDSPDRHLGEDEAWLEALERFALSDRQFAVVATVARIPDSWTGPVAYLGVAEWADGLASDEAPAPLPDAAPEETSEDSDDRIRTGLDEHVEPSEPGEPAEPVMPIEPATAMVPAVAEPPHEPAESEPAEPAPAEPEPSEPVQDPSASAEPGTPEEQDTPTPTPRPASDPSQAKD